MTTELATRRYFKVFFPSIVAYLVGSVGTIWASENLALSPYALYGLAVVPIVAMVAIFWAHWRFINEIDEYLRLIQIKAVLFGIASVMVVATGWGTLEMLVDAPKLQVFWLMPIFLTTYSTSVGLISKKEGTF